MAAVLLLGEFHLGNDIFSLLGRKAKITSGDAADERITGTKKRAENKSLPFVGLPALALSTPESIEIIEKNDFHLRFFSIRGSARPQIQTY